MVRLSCQYTLHVVIGAKCLAAARTLSGTVRDKILDAAVAEHVATKLEYGVANVGVADWANGDFLFQVSTAA